MCKKQCYDKKTAQTILNERKQKSKKWAREIRIYFCEQCNGFHLTSKEEWEQPLQLKQEELIFCDLWKKLKGID